MIFLRKEMDLTSGNLFKKIIIYSIPVILSGILQLLYTAADLIVCGKFGSPNATAAISSTNSLVHLIVNLFMGLSIGANVLMARCYGQQNKEKAQRVLYTSMIFSIAVGVVVGLFGALMSGRLLILMNTTSDVIDLSTKYLFIYFLGLPFLMVYNFGSSLLRAVGDTKRPFIYLTISGVVNVILNLIFVIVFKMDVPGVALATILAQGVSAALVFRCLLKNKGFFQFRFSELKFYKTEALEIIRIGLPAGIQGALFSFSNVIIQSSVNSLGTNVVGGNGASGSLEGFIYTSMNAVAQACVAFVSANFGAGKKNNIKKSLFYCMSLIVVVSFLVGGIILIFHNPLLSLYVHTDEALEAGTNRLLIIALTYFLCGFMDCLAYALRGIGYSLIPMIVSLIGACGFRLFWIFVFFPMEKLNNIQGLAVSYPISWILTSSVHLIMFIILFKKLKLNNEIEAI